MADFDISIGANFDAALEKVSKLDNLTGKQFKALQKTIAKELRGAEKSAKKFSKTMKKDVGDVGKKSFESVKEAAEGFGGATGGAIGQVEKFGKSVIALSGVIGPVGAGMLAASLSLAAMGGAALFAGKAFIDAADAAGEFANANKDMVPPETLAALDTFNDSVAAVGRELMATGAILVGDVAFGMEDATRLAIKMAIVARKSAGQVREAFETVAEVVEENRARFEFLVNMFGGSVSKGVLSLANTVDDLTGSWTDLDDEVDAAIAKSAEIREETEKTTKAEEELTDAQVNRMINFVGLKQQAEEAAAAELKAANELQAAWDKARDVMKSAADEAEALAGRIADANGEKIELVKEAAISSLGVVADFATLVTEKLEKTIETNEGLVDGLQEQLRRSADAKAEFAETGEKSDDILTKSEEKRINASIKLHKEEADAAKEKANKAAKIALTVQKAITSQQILLASFEMYAKMVAFFAGAGPAAFGIAGAIVGPFTAGQLALVAAQKAPTFAGGGMVGDKVGGDHVTIAASRDEGVVKGQGIAALGGPAGLDALNSGKGMGQTLIIQMDGQTIAEAISNSPTAVKIIARAVGARGLRGAF